MATLLQHLQGVVVECLDQEEEEQVEVGDLDLLEEEEVVEEHSLESVFLM